MSNLTLITTEDFNNLSCNFYRNMNDDILLTREQIGQALEYVDPSKAIRKIHFKHKDRLDELCVRIKDKTFDCTQNGAIREQNENLITERVYYTERGIMEICRWSRQPKANLFMDWVWDIIEKYRHNTLNTQQNIQPLIDAVTTLTQTITQMQEDISALKSQTSSPISSTKKLSELKYSRWKSRMFEKLKLLTEYANSNSAYNITLADTLHITINEMQDTYDIELSDYIKDYMLENSSEEKPYDLDVINYYKNIRDLYSSTVDSIMERLNLRTDISSPKNIFDILAQNIA